MDAPTCALNAINNEGATSGYRCTVDFGGVAADSVEACTGVEGTGSSKKVAKKAAYAELYRVLAATYGEGLGIKVVVAPGMVADTSCSAAAWKVSGTSQAADEQLQGGGEVRANAAVSVANCACWRTRVVRGVGPKCRPACSKVATALSGRKARASFDFVALFCGCIPLD